jgi:cytochrome c-type biogenesis protein
MMEGVFLAGSVAAAFVAGTIALFAPCCILVVFPSYLAAAVRNRRWRLVPLTFVFAAGLSVVLLPAALGASLLTRSLLRLHGPVYVAGGILLLALAAVTLSGRVWSLPMLRRSPDISRTDSGGVFALGVFSGAASACCAPVLVGVLTLTALAPSVATMSAVAFAYVAGMVAPLVVLTLVWDRTGLRNRIAIRGRTLQLRVGTWRRAVGLLDLVAAGMFTLMGGALIAVGASGSVLAPTFQVGVGQRLRTSLEPLVVALEPVPDPVVAVGLLAGALGAVWLSARSGRTRRSRKSETGDVVSVHPNRSEPSHDEPSCH